MDDLDRELLEAKKTVFDVTPKLKWYQRLWATLVRIYYM